MSNLGLYFTFSGGSNADFMDCVLRAALDDAGQSSSDGYSNSGSTSQALAWGIISGGRK